MVIQTVSSVRTQQMHESLCWSDNTGVSMYRNPLKKKVMYESVFYVSSITPYVLFILLEGLVKLFVNGRKATVLKIAASRICSKQILSSSLLVFSPCVSLAFKIYNHTSVQTQLGKNPFYSKREIKLPYNR